MRNLRSLHNSVNFLILWLVITPFRFKPGGVIHFLGFRIVKWDFEIPVQNLRDFFKFAIRFGKWNGQPPFKWFTRFGGTQQEGQEQQGNVVPLSGRIILEARATGECCSNIRKGGGVAERARLESGFASKGATGVRIPPFPQTEQSPPRSGFFRFRAEAWNFFVSMPR